MGCSIKPRVLCIPFSGSASLSTSSTTNSGQARQQTGRLENPNRRSWSRLRMNQSYSLLDSISSQPVILAVGLTKRVSATIIIGVLFLQKGRAHLVLDEPYQLMIQHCNTNLALLYKIPVLRAVP